MTAVMCNHTDLLVYYMLLVTGKVVGVASGVRSAKFTMLFYIELNKAL